MKSIKRNRPISGVTNKVNPAITPQISAACGSVKGKYAVVLDGGKTTIFISDKSREAETIERYNQRKGR